MSKRRSVGEHENREIVQMLAAKVQTVDIAKRLKRDHRTIKKYVENIDRQRKTRTDAGKRKVTSRDMRKLKFALAKNPLATANEQKNFFNWSTGTRVNPVPSRGNQSICITMPHHMLPSIREIFWLYRGSRNQSL